MVMWNLASRSFAVLLLCFVGIVTGCGNDSSAVPIRIEIVPSSTLLKAGGDSALRVVGYDENDKEVSVKGSWSSDSAAVVSVDGGKVHAESNIGSATVSVTVGELSANALVYIAEPAPGAVLFGDDQVISAPVGVMSNGEIVGSQYQIGLRDVDAPPGTILIPTGDTPGMGIVTAVDGDLYTVEAIAVNQAFKNLDIQQLVETSMSAEEFTALNDDLPAGTSALRTFECSNTSGVTVTPMFPTPKVRPVVKFDGYLKIRNFEMQAVRMVMDVGAILEVEGNFELPALFTGGFDCELILGDLPIEGIGGPMSMFVRPTVPFGLGLSAQATIRADPFRVEVSGKTLPQAAVGATVKVGLDWTAENGLSPIFEKNPVADVKLKLVTPPVDGNLTNSLRYLVDARVFATSGLDVKPRFSFVGDPRFQMIDLDAGLLQKASFANLVNQASDASYASNYEILAFVKAEAGEQIKGFLKYLGGVVDPPTYEAVSDPLTQSPTGDFSAPSSVALDTEAKLKVTLQNTTYLGIYNVYAVRVWAQIDDGPWEEVAYELNVPNDKTVFDLSWIPTAPAFYDGAKVRLMPTVETFLLPGVDLEIQADARRSLVVAECPVNRIAILEAEGIFHVAADGTDRVDILPPPTLLGDSFAFSVDMAPNLCEVAYAEGGLLSIEIRSLNPEGGGLSLLPPPVNNEVYQHMTWSPDGSKIAFQSSEDGGTIWVADADGGNLLQVSSTPYSFFPQASLPRFSPDGTKIAFIARIDPDINAHLYVVNVDGTGQYRVNPLEENLATTFNSVQGSAPQWNADGSRLLYIGNSKVLSIAVNGTDPQSLIPIDEYVDVEYPSFKVSPDGTKIAYRPDSANSIRIMNIDGTNPVEIVADQGISPDYADCISWSPDGTRLVYDLDNVVHVVDIDGSNDAVIFNGTAVACVAWSP